MRVVAYVSPHFQVVTHVKMGGVPIRRSAVNYSEYRLRSLRSAQGVVRVWRGVW